MTTQNKRRIQIDDLQIGTCMTVFRNRFPAAPIKGAPESDFLKGSLLQVQALNLPYVLVRVTDPLRGKQSLAVDVRDHVFMPVNDEYARAIIESTPEAIDPAQ